MGGEQTTYACRHAQKAAHGHGLRFGANCAGTYSLLCNSISIAPWAIHASVMATNIIMYHHLIVQQCASMVPRAAGEVVGATSSLLYRSAGASLMHDLDSGRVSAHSLSLSFSIPCPDSPVIGGIVRPSPDQPLQASAFDYMHMKW